MILMNNFKVAFIFLFFMSLSLTAQEKHTIILNVDTKNLTIENMDQTCNFGQPRDVSNEGYTVDVALGDTVVWSGVSTSNSGDTVEITKIVYSSGTNLLDDRVIRDIDGEVIAEIKLGQEDDYLKYDIEFKIIRNGRSAGTFTIDPKLRVKLRSSVRE